MKWVWTGLVLAGVVAIAFGRWWDGWQARAVRQAEHEAWIRQILGDDREVAELEEMARRVAREHKQNS